VEYNIIFYRDDISEFQFLTWPRRGEEEIGGTSNLSSGPAVFELAALVSGAGAGTNSSRTEGQSQTDCWPGHNR
jgi:hypothetical protein